MLCLKNTVKKYTTTLLYIFIQFSFFDGGLAPRINGSNPNISVSSMMGGNTPLNLSTSIPSKMYKKSRIIGGIMADRNQFPYQVSIQKQVSYINVQHFCGGSILQEKVVLTAAHCFDDIELGRGATFVVAAGLVTLDKRISTTQFRPIDRIIRHPSYNPKTATGDCSLVMVAQGFNFNVGVKPVLLASNRPEVNVICEVAGWGSTSVEPLRRTGTLHFMISRIIQDDYCAEYYAFEWNETGMLCAGGDRNKDSCNGDSGGPLVCNSVQVGIVSFGTSVCGIGVPEVYTNVAHYRDWIMQTARKNSVPESPEKTNHCCIYFCCLFMIIQFLYYQVNYVSLLKSNEVNF